MAYRQNQDAGSYTDGVRVKISEKYKPPPKITLPMGYSQRIELNKQVRDSIPSYDFSLEKTVKEKMREWREVRLSIKNDRKERLAKLRELQDKETETEEDFITSKIESVMLIPTQANQILKPVAIDKSPFNLSDFDTDTSSPFDNMALKSINDMDELALVLNNDSKINTATFTQTYENNTQNYLYQPSTSSNSYHFPSKNSTSTTVATNGFLRFYDNPESNFNNSKPFKNVPDIMIALQAKLDSNKLSHVTVNTSKVDVVDECFGSLSGDLQKTASEVSGMGFPLDRVSRVCKLIGDDRKRIVEHLLALSDLLDLGFPESDVSKALFECDNDRDKALDRLIS